MTTVIPDQELKRVVFEIQLGHVHSCEVWPPVCVSDEDVGGIWEVMRRRTQDLVPRLREVLKPVYEDKPVD